MSEVEPDSGGGQRGTSEGALPGWYPDPRGSGNLLYWDGSEWTGDVHVPGSPPARAAAGPLRRLDRVRMLVAGGGVALGISPFLTWVKVILLGNLSLFQLFSATGRANGWAWGAVVAGGTAVYVGLREGSAGTVRATGLGIGLLGGALATYALIGLRDELRDVHGLATVGIGPYVAIAGCVALVAGGVMARSRPPGR